MTALLEQELRQAAQDATLLPAEKQDQLAILEAIDALEWERQFAASQDVLRLLEAEGLADLEAGLVLSV